MTPDVDNSQHRFAALERSLRRTQLAFAVVTLALVAALGFQWLHRPATSAELRTHRLVVLDDHGVKRVEIGQDPASSPRRDRSAGLWIFDGRGHERGGMSTFADGSVAMALDAPDGVGSEPRDRLGLRVDADGSSAVLLTDNRTGGVVRLYSDGNGDGGVQTLKADTAARQIHIRTSSFDGDKRDTLPMPTE